MYIYCYYTWLRVKRLKNFPEQFYLYIYIFGGFILNTACVLQIGDINIYACGMQPQLVRFSADMQVRFAQKINKLHRLLFWRIYTNLMDDVFWRLMKSYRSQAHKMCIIFFKLTAFLLFDKMTFKSFSSFRFYTILEDSFLS